MCLRCVEVLPSGGSVWHSGSSVWELARQPVMRERECGVRPAGFVPSAPRGLAGELSYVRVVPPTMGYLVGIIGELLDVVRRAPMVLEGTREELVSIAAPTLDVADEGRCDAL